MAAHARRVAERDLHLVRLAQRLHTAQQPIVAALDRFEVRSGDEDQRFGVGNERLAAAAGSLEDLQQRGQPIEVRVGVAAIPCAQRQQL
jgi:hypothetical protein